MWNWELHTFMSIVRILYISLYYISPSEEITTSSAVSNSSSDDIFVSSSTEVSSTDSNVESGIISLIISATTSPIGVTSSDISIYTNASPPNVSDSITSELVFKSETNTGIDIAASLLICGSSPAIILSSFIPSSRYASGVFNDGAIENVISPP